jgi:hypothetical protein
VEWWIDVVDGGDGGVVEGEMEILLSSFLFWLALIYGAVMSVVLPLYVIAMAERLKRMEKGLKALHEQLEKLVWYARVKHEREERGRL